MFDVKHFSLKIHQPPILGSLGFNAVGGLSRHFPQTLVLCRSCEYLGSQPLDQIVLG
jgi:hypothetical protein